MNLIEGQGLEIKEIVAKFRAMADHLEKNDGSPFGGAMVVIPPPNGGDPIETWILDANQDPAQFWILLKTKADTRIAAIDAAQRNTMAFGR